MISLSKVVRYYEHTDEVVEISTYEVEEEINYLEDEDDILDSSQEYLKEAKQKAEAIIAKANAQAKRVVEDAKALATAVQRKYLEEAQFKIQELEDQALRDGYEQGFLRKSDELAEAIQTIHREMKASINYLKQQNAHIVKQQEEQLKFLALEIASKIMHQRIEENPMVLQALVLDALLMTKKSKRIQVQLPDNAKELMLALEEDFRNQPAYQGRNMNVETKELAAGSVFVESDMGLYDVSIDTQLENLKKLFVEYE